jgi:hypothetical protein
LSNLRWGTPKQNADDKLRHGTHLLGDDHHRSKLDSSDVLRIRGWINSKFSVRAIASVFGVSQSTIFAIKCGRTWKHVA